MGKLGLKLLNLRVEKENELENAKVAKMLKEMEEWTKVDVKNIIGGNKMFKLIGIRVSDKYSWIINKNLTKTWAVSLADQWERALSDEDKDNFFYEVRNTKTNVVVHKTKCIII